MRYNAAKALEKLFSAASDAGYKLYGVSGYRSYATQKAIFDKRAAERGEEVANKTSARPGQSEHQTGLAMDISSKAVDYRLVTSFGDTAEGKWVKKNAHRFGFIIRYPKGKETITGYSYEPWHLRYVGITAAKYIYEHGLTLEEYFYQVHNYPQP
jgi:LAS superfamily LD-carboxypeptidase LdcB